MVNFTFDVDNNISMLQKFAPVPYPEYRHRFPVHSGNTRDQRANHETY